MSEQDGSETTTSDQALVEQTRAGDQRAFAELWRRHYRSGARVARQFTSSIDADDLVAEAYTRIYQRVLAGGGPTGAFRPYLYTTIRNIASTWGAARHDVQVDDITEFEDPTTTEDPAAIALDRTLTVRAFRTLPDRWQSVLWYTEVEGMDPHEVAPLMGMTANGVAALSYRAREGLRKAWLQAHINEATGSGECQWAMSRLGDHTRKGLGARDKDRMEFHLATCAKCAIISEEVGEVGSRLALVMVPLLLGGVAGGTFLASFGHAASSAQAIDIPALPEALTAGGAAATGVLGFLGGAAAPVALVGGLAVVVAVSGSAVLLAPKDPAPEDASSGPGTSETVIGPEDLASNSPSVGPTLPPGATGALPIDDPANIPPLGGVVGSVGDTVGDVVDGVGGVVDGVEDGVIDPVLEAVLPSVHADINITGHGIPGAEVIASVDGLVYASTTVGGNGVFSLTVSGLPIEITTIDVDQNCSGLLGCLLGGLLTTVSNTGGLVLNLL
jgi:RNA polymerase sigma factor (sigma-70 family)